MQVVSTAYDLTGSGEQWQDRVMHAIAPLIEDRGAGVMSVLWTATHDRRVSLSSYRFLRCSTWTRRTAPLIGAATMCLPRARVYDYFVNGPALAQARAALGEGTVRSIGRRVGVRIPDARVVQGRDQCGAMLHVLAPQRGIATFDERSRAELAQLAEHLGAALRLRRSVSVNVESNLIEARFDADGRCVDAAGQARDPDLRDRLRHYVRRHASNAAATSSSDNTWQDLVSGRWSLVDRFDRHGRRFIVVYRNPPGVIDPRRLSPREATVATMVARGSSYKEAAAALRISASSVGDHVARVVRKLGLRSRLEIPGFYLAANHNSTPIGPDSDLGIVVTEHQSAPPPWFTKLTPAENDVARQVLAGASTQTIAAARGSRPRTIANQLASIFDKLGVRSRAELCARAENDDK